MHPSLLRGLRTRSPVIRRHWESLLRIEPVNGPLANPDTMVNLIPQSLEEILTAAARSPHSAHSVPAPRDGLPDCHCGYNPYIAFFIAAEQALVEAAVLIQADLPPHERQQADVLKLKGVVRHLARADIDAFCGICTHRGTARGCLHFVAAH